jgi:nitroreductase family protein
MPLITRRRILLTGAGTVVILGGGWAMTRDPKQARAPWRKAREGFGDPRLDVLAYAILAPNPHNMQPWRVRLDGDDSFTVFCDLNRTLPQTDPPNRQITIGFGCFLELARQAAAEKGYRAEIEYFPEGEPFPLLDKRPVAHVKLVEGAPTRDALFSEVLSRRTNRLAFDMAQTPSSDDLAAITNAASPAIFANASSDSKLVEDLRALTVNAWRVEWATPRTRRESIEVTRIGKNEINEKPYGLALAGAPMDALSAVGLLTAEKMDDAAATAYKQGLSFYEKACETATAYAWIKTAANTRRDQLDTGRSWVRMQLAATARNVAFHPLSQALQEFPEMSEHYERIHHLLGAENGETVQMLVRLGYAGAIPPAPREPLASKLIEG